MTRLHSLFRSADSLGSLIDPRPANRGDGLFGRDLSIGAGWDRVRDLLRQALQSEAQAETALGHAAEDVVHAAGLLARTYTIVATNPPFLQRNFMDDTLARFVDAVFPTAKSELAACFIERCRSMTEPGGAFVLVSPQGWTQLGKFKALRKTILSEAQLKLVARLGAGAFRQISGEVVKVVLSVARNQPSTPPEPLYGVLAQRQKGPELKATLLRRGDLACTTVQEQRSNPDSRLTLTRIDQSRLLEGAARGFAGIQTGDYLRFGRLFWEIPLPDPRWARQQSTVNSTTAYGGREHVLLWEGGSGALHDYVAERLGEWGTGAWIRGQDAWGKRGVAVSQMGQLPVTLYTGELTDTNAAIVLPKRIEDLPAIWAYCSSPEFAENVRDIDDSLKVTNSTLVKVDFDRERWQRIADQSGPLPLPHSDDPTQWIFKGVVPDALYPLQVAVARLLGYRWPDQESDLLDGYADRDGIASLQSLPGEPDLATRLRELLAVAYGSEWTSSFERQLVMDAGGNNGRLEDWLRDSFFVQHAKVFRSRPFLWHIWDGRKDGFSAVVNYHRLDHKTLEKLTFTSLGAWIGRQKHEADAARAGADARLAAAENLQRKLKLILEGAPPYDVYVRWKSMAEQPIGWNPELDDGVRLNARPFVTAGVLRAKVNVHWKKDRGNNLDGTERHNDLHPTLEERRAARRDAEAAE